MRDARLALTATALLFGAAPLAAGPAGFEGRYVGGDKSRATKQYSHSLEVQRRAGGRFGVEVVVGTPDCSGVFDGDGALDGDVLKAVTKEDNQTCTLTLRRAKKGVSVEEDSHCLYFHGGSCEFGGDYRKR